MFFSKKKVINKKKRPSKKIFFSNISVRDPCDPFSFRRPKPKDAATQFWVATHGLRTQALSQSQVAGPIVASTYHENKTKNKNIKCLKNFELTKTARLIK